MGIALYEIADADQPAWYHAGGAAARYPAERCVGPFLGSYK